MAQILHPHTVFIVAMAAASSLLAAPMAAQAATAKVVPLLGGSVDLLRYDAAPSETNRVSMRWVGDEGSSTSGAWIISDATAPIAAGESCSATDAHTVRCQPRDPGADGRARSLAIVRVSLGDESDELGWLGATTPGAITALGGPGDDRLSAPAAGPCCNEPHLHGEGGDDVLVGGNDPSYLFGGPGNDRLKVGLVGYVYGGAGDDRLVGGRGDDELDGGGGRDRLYAGAGEDILSDGDRSGASGESRPGPDRLDGGAGRDRASYFGRRARIIVDLADDRPDGERGEGDTLVAIEDVVGGKGDDDLAGDHRSNDLRSDAGDDRLRGRGGDDELWVDTGRDSVSCGRGADLVTGETDALDLLMADCEGMSQYGLVRAPYPARMGPRSLGYGVSCPDDGEHPATEPCSASVRLTEASVPHRLLASGRLRSGRGRSRKLILRIAPLGNALASRPSGVRAIVSVTSRFAPPRRPRAARMSWSIQLRLPGGRAAG